MSNRSRTPKSKTPRSLKAKNEFFEGIRDGLKSVIEDLQAGRPLSTRQVMLPETPAPMKPTEIVELRVKKCNVSQAVFAAWLNVSPKTVQAWEQGISRPSGPSLRLLHLAAAHTAGLRRHVSPSVGGAEGIGSVAQE